MNMKRIILPISLLALSAAAFAHPHKSDEANEEPQVQRVWPFFGDKVKSQKNESNIKAEKETKKVVRIKPKPTTDCLLYTSPSPRDRGCSRMPSSA